jgi:hypothetical protein
LETFKHPSCQPVVSEVRDFISRFPKVVPPGQREQAAERIHTFLTSADGKLAQAEVLQGVSKDEMNNMLEGLEKFVVNKLFNRLFQCEPSDIAIDATLSKHIECLSWVTLEHLEIPVVVSGIDFMNHAVDNLRRIVQFKSPKDKLQCMLNACHLILSVLQQSNGTADTATADDFLPLLIYTILKANPSNLHSTLEYIQYFRHPDRLAGADEYLFTNLQSAVSFVQEINASVLTVSEEEYTWRYRTAEVAAFAERLRIERLEEQGSDMQKIIAQFSLSFEGEQFKDISAFKYSDVPQLLEEYRRLARFVRKAEQLMTVE